MSAHTANDRELFDLLDIGVIVAGSHDRRIRRVNTRARQLLGRAANELIGSPWERFVHPAEREARIESCRLSVATERTCPQHVVMRAIRPDGSCVHCLVSTVLVEDPQDGEPLTFSHLQDVSPLMVARTQLDLIVENSNVWLFLLDRTGRILAATGGPAVPDAAKRLHRARASTVFEAFPENRRRHSNLRRALGGERVQATIKAYGRLYDLQMAPIRGADSRVTSVAVVGNDVTEREKAQAELRRRAAEQTVVADLAQRAIDGVDTATLWAQAARALADHLDADLVEGVRLARGDDDGDEGGLVLARAEVKRPAGESGRGAPSPGEHTRNRSERAPRPAILSVPVGRPDRPTAMIIVHRTRGTPDEARFTAQETQFVRTVGTILASAATRFEMEAELRYRSTHDGLTGLANRTALLDRLQHALNRSQRDQHRIGVLFLDLNGFKTINDRFGHRAGDELLGRVAGLLRHAVRPGDTVSRLAGDEFAIVCEDITDIDVLRVMADRVLQEISRPSQVTGCPVTVTASIGLALSGPTDHDAEELLHGADLAMYTAKQADTGRAVVFDPSMHDRS
ncbi:sensor domain-containing protein [Frankia gtarii]|uniref:sensor domain-containing protein n=1 Tax=Frankia gtarii TaxID=2950102 RepID=UPI0021BFCC47|nr:diguanylate cyclase [Frankia gtarii]